MRHCTFAMSLALSVILVGCGKPQDIVFGPEPLKQIANEGDKFKKLPEADRTLLVQYITASELQKASQSNGNGPAPVLGRTVGEVLEHANVLKAKYEAEKAEQEKEFKKKEAETAALRARVEAERKDVLERIRSSVVIAVIDKTVLPKNYDVGRYSELLSIKYAIENKADKAIRQIKGRVTFKDATGDEIGWLPVDIDESVGPGKTLKTSTNRGWKINEFRNGEIEKIAGREWSMMTATFEPSTIAFDGGQVLKAPELP
jgi:hypothetical protein